ncbi:MAG: response regulator, partial [Desulfamplus sp.]|nr:response regulator [Desulfamplus sp.]
MKNITDTSKGNPAKQSQGGNILIVDDNAQNLRLLLTILNGDGHKVRPAPSGPIALESAFSKVPDLILLDIMMPGMDGYEVCKRLKENEETRDVPVIFISAMDALSEKLRAFDVGGVDYITKPFQPREITA